MPPASEMLVTAPTFFARHTDLRQKTPAVVTGAVTINASSHALEKRRKQNAERRRNPAATSGLRRAPSGALAFRRSTTAPA